VAVCCLLAGLNVVLVLGLRGMAANTILATLDLAFATFYAARPANRRAFVDAIVLLKYPTFIAILARDISFEVLSLAAAIFALACVFEAWHDSPSSVRLHADRPPAPRIPL
jgi:hypothetical protein